MRSNNNSTRLSHFLSWLVLRNVAIPVVVGVVLIGIVLAGWQMNKRDHAMNIGFDTRDNLDHFSSRLEVHIATRLAMGELLRRQWQNGTITDQLGFSREARTILELFEDFQAINWVDAEGIIRWVVPFEGNEAAQDLDLNKLSFPSEAMKNARQTNKIQITPPIKLAQSGLGFVAYIPVIKNEKLLGYVDIVFRTELMLNKILNEDQRNSYKFVITDGKSLVYETGESAISDAYSQQQNVLVGNRNWTITASPTLSMIASHSSNVGVLILIFGLSLSVVLALLVHLAIMRHKSLMESETRLRDFADTSSDWFWEMDENGRITWTSDSVEQAGGLSSEAIKGLTREEIAGEFASDDIWKEYRHAQQSHSEIKDFEFRYRAGDGKVNYASISGKPLFNDGGLFIGYRGTASNVTAGKELEEQVRRSQKMEAVGQLTGGIAHDFNNILGIIQGNLELLEDILIGNNSALDRVRKALKGVGRGTDITRKLLGFSSKNSQHIRPVDANRFIESLEDLIASSLTASIIVQTKLSADLWPVAIDTGDLEDAILNLSLNARDAMQDGGSLMIETKNVILHGGQAEKENDGQQDFVMISINDTGTGMSDDIREKVLEPFFTTKEQGKGTGLGLSMVYGFVQRSGGFLNIQSEIGQGTKIQLYFPRSLEQPVVQDTTEIDMTDLPGGKETILVVDDEVSLRKVAVAHLQSLGYQAVDAENGNQALELLRENNNISLLFSDVIMPGKLDGFQLAEAAHKEHPSLRILLTSGYTRRNTDFSDKADNFLATIDSNLLRKPYNKTRLAVTVRQILDETHQ